MSAGRIVLVVAVQLEADAVRRAFGLQPLVPEPWRLQTLDGRFDLLLAGVGKSNAAGAVARAVDPARCAGAVSVGVCGSLPGGPPIGAAVAATASIYADEGIVTPAGFETMAQMGFPLEPLAGNAVGVDPAWSGLLAGVAEARGPIATVSTCSGTDAAARAVVARTGAIAEAMEGAAVGHALARLGGGMRFAELRVVSNTTGDRQAQRWDLHGALARLTEVLGPAVRLGGVGGGPGGW